MATTIHGTTVKYSVEHHTDDGVTETEFDIFSDAWDYCINKPNNSEGSFVILEVVNGSVHKCWSIRKGELTHFD
jgi:hypothetical protein